MKKRVLLFVFMIASTATFAQKVGCQFGNCRDGFGTFITEDGSKYIGQFDNFLSNGQGVCFFKNGDKYIGTWKEGEFNGEGRMMFTNGAVQAGIWEKGTFAKEQNAGCLTGDCKNGYSIYLYEDGTKYLGPFKDGQTTGQGTCFFPDGNKYVGSWKNHNREGFGTMYYGDGTMEEGMWSENNFIGASKDGKGCISGDCKDGPGIYVYQDNTRYEGEFNNSLAHGKGICYYSDGDQYEGEWQFHTFDGFGTMYLSDGSSVKGVWRAGKFIGDKQETPAANANSGAPQPKVWALLVGVARYNHMKSLKFTDDDAYRMFAFLKSPEGGALPDEQIKVLIDEDATKENILSNMDDIFEQAGENDVVMFYFSGHGLRGCFLPSDYDGEDNKLLHTDILDKVSKCKAKGKVIIADACHSGSLQDEMVALKDGSVMNVIESYYEAFNASSGGTALMLSSKAEETSIENNGLRQGIFSHFLIRGLKGAADTDNDKIVTVDELFKYIEANVKYYTNNYQTPVINGSFDKNMPLGVIR